MKLFELLQICNHESWKAIRSQREIAFKYGDKFLTPHHVEMSGDSKTLILVLKEDTSATLQGIHPAWAIDKSSKISQKQAIKEWLLAGHKITPLDALEMFGCFRLGAQIFNLKAEGMAITCVKKKDPKTGKRYGTYWLEKEKPTVTEPDL